MKYLKGCLLFVLLCLVWLATTAIKVRAEEQGPLALALALPLVLVVVVIMRLGMAHVRRYFAISAEILLRHDDRDPILVLRSFKVDGRYHLRSDSALKWFFFGRLNLEFVLSDECSRAGPVIAIGRPGETLPPLGASRNYLTHDDWESEVTSYIEDARLIVVILDQTEGVQQEYHLLARHGGLRKTVFVVPPLDDAALDLVYLRFRRFAKNRGLQVPVQLSPETAFLVPGQTDEFVPLASSSPTDRRTRARTYRRPLVQYLKQYLSSSRRIGGGYFRGDPYGIGERAAISSVGPLRFYAAVIDATFGLFVGFIVVMFLGNFLHPGLFGSESGEPSDSTMYLFAWLALPAYVFLVEGLLALSIGKRIFNLIITSIDGRLASRRKLLYRATIKALSWLLVAPALFGVLSAFHTVHDKIAATRVRRA